MNVETIFEDTQAEYEKGIVLFMDATQLGQMERAKELADKLYEVGEIQYRAATWYVELVDDFIEQEKDHSFKKILAGYRAELCEMAQETQDLDEFDFSSANG